MRQVHAAARAALSSTVSLRSWKMEKTKVVALIEALEAEVNNGGFDQFFFNNAGDQTAETIEALIAIGATHTASIVRAAATSFTGCRSI